jgi:hypothetical protein
MSNQAKIVEEKLEIPAGGGLSMRCTSQSTDLASGTHANVTHELPAHPLCPHVEITAGH